MGSPLKVRSATFHCQPPHLIMARAVDRKANLWKAVIPPPHKRVCEGHTNKKGCPTAFPSIGWRLLPPSKSPSQKHRRHCSVHFRESHANLPPEIMVPQISRGDLVDCCSYTETPSRSNPAHAGPQTREDHQRNVPEVGSWFSPKKLTARNNAAKRLGYLGQLLPHLTHRLEFEIASISSAT